MILSINDSGGFKAANYLDFPGKAIHMSVALNGNIYAVLYNYEDATLIAGEDTLNVHSNYSNPNYTLVKLGKPTVTNSITVTPNIELKVYPNPSNGIFKIDLPSSLEDYNIEVYDCKGARVYKGSSQGSTELTFLDKPNGIYLIKILGNDIKYTSKLLLYK
jgi:hypothetical protein